MSTHEVYCSLDICKLLKEAGFDWEVSHWYADKPDDKELYEDYAEPMNANQYMDPYHYYQAFSAPTIEVAQRWLREVKKMYIEIRRMPKCDLFDRYFTSIAIMQEPFDTELRDKNDEIIYISGKTYEEVKEAAIKKALEIILEKGE